MPKLLNETKHYRAAVRIRELANTLPPGESLPVASELTRRLGISLVRRRSDLPAAGKAALPDRGTVRAGIGPDQHGPA